MSTHPHNPTPLIASPSHSNTQPNSKNDTANQSSASSKIERALQDTLSALTDSLGSILSPRTTSVHEKVRSLSVLGSESRVDGTPSFKHTGKKPVEVEESGGALGFF